MPQGPPTLKVGETLRIKKFPLDTFFGHSLWSLAISLWLDSFSTGFTFQQNFETSQQGLPPRRVGETLRHERESYQSIILIDTRESNRNVIFYLSS